MPDQRVIVLIGLPGSGKSTWTLQQSAAPVSSDELRRLLRDDPTDQTIHGLVFRLMRELLRLRIQLGAATTVLDSTNLTRKHRRPFIKISQFAGCRTEAVWFDTPVEECIRRNQQRHRQVPEQAIHELARRLQPPTIDEGFDLITVVSKDGEQTTIRRPESASQIP